MFYSASGNAFFPGHMRADYERAGTWPEDAIDVTDEEWQTYGQGNPPAGMRRDGDADGRPTWVEIPPLTIEELAVRKRTAMGTARDAAFATGMPYTFPDGADDVVQTRAEDKTNLLGLSIEAQLLIDAGDTISEMEFRGLANVSRYLTPPQMLDMTRAALGHIKGIYDHSWAKKDQIEAAREAGDRAAIEAVEW